MALQRVLTASSLSKRRRRTLSSLPSLRLAVLGESMSSCTHVRRLTIYRLMLVGLGGNNGTTVLATNLANKHNISWHTKNGIQQPNYIGSVVRASTVRLGTDPATGKDVFVPISDMLPMVHPNDFVIGGWDISSLSMDKAMLRAKVLEWDLQRQLIPLMEDVKPLPSIYCEQLSSSFYDY